MPNSRRRFYWTTRDLHLYTGLFLSPLVVLFAVSAILLVHAPTLDRDVSAERTVAGLSIPLDIETLRGGDQVAACRALLDQAGVAGEIEYIRVISKEHRIILPVVVPGRETTVDVNLVSRSAKIAERRTGLAGALVYLHKKPGPHNAAVRGNSAFMRFWRWLADTAAYLILFLTTSGVYLWMVLRAERRTGLRFLLAGTVSFFGIVYALCR